MYSTGKTSSGETTPTPTEKAHQETLQASSTKQEAEMVFRRTLDGLAIRNTGRECQIVQVFRRSIVMIVLWMMMLTVVELQDKEPSPASPASSSATSFPGKHRHYVMILTGSRCGAWGIRHCEP